MPPGHSEESKHFERRSAWRLPLPEAPVPMPVHRRPSCAGPAAIRSDFWTSDQRGHPVVEPPHPFGSVFPTCFPDRRGRVSIFLGPARRFPGRRNARIDEPLSEPVESAHAGDRSSMTRRFGPTREQAVFGRLPGTFKSRLRSDMLTCLEFRFASRQFELRTVSPQTFLGIHCRPTRTFWCVLVKTSGFPGSAARMNKVLTQSSPGQARRGSLVHRPCRL